MATRYPCERVGLDFVDSARYRFVSTVDLASTPEQLFEVLAEADSWSRWATAIADVTWTSPQPYGVGTTRTVTMRGGAVNDAEFVAWERFSHMAFRLNQSTTKGLAAFVEDYQVQDTPGGCRLHVDRCDHTARPEHSVRHVRRSPDHGAGVPALCRQPAALHRRPLRSGQRERDATMKRIQYHQYGGPEVMRFEDFEPARPGDGEVLVRVRAAAANPYDWKVRNGEMKIMTGQTFPRGMGYDFAGVVEAVGHGVTRLGVGDDVLGAAQIKASGAFADMVVADEDGVAKKPAGLSFEEAAAIPTIGVAALQAVVNKGQLQPGQAVFVHGCLGGVGRAAVQIALARGASVAGSCRASAMQDARDLGVAPTVEFDSSQPR